MRRCYRAAALVLGTILTTGLASFNSCSIGTLTAYAAEDTLTEELATAFQQEVQAGAENVETEIPAEEAAVQPAQEEPMAEEVVPEEPVPEEPAPEEVPTEAVAANFNLDEQEYQVLLRIVEAEAGGEDTVPEPGLVRPVGDKKLPGQGLRGPVGAYDERHGGHQGFDPGRY